MKVSTFPEEVTLKKKFKKKEAFQGKLKQETVWNGQTKKIILITLKIYVH